MQDYKSLFFIPRGCYLANHSMGCLPKSSFAAMNHSLHSWQEKGVQAWDEYLSELDLYHLALSKILKGDKKDFCYQANVSSGLSKILSALINYNKLNPIKRNKIVASELDFPSCSFVLNQAKLFGYEVIIVPAKEGVIDLVEWDQYLSEEVLAVFLTHVSNKNNFRMPIKGTVDRCKLLGIISIIDIAQSVGIVPIDLREWDPYFVIGSCLKWCCGGPGTGFLWANPKYVNNFRPIDIGWFSQDNPFDFTQKEFHYAAFAARFMGGTPSIFPPLIAKHSLDLIESIGVEVIYNHNQKLIEDLWSFCRDMNITPISLYDKNKRGGSLCLKLENPKGAFSFLKEKGVICESGLVIGDNSFLRFSPHIYNNVEDLNMFKNALRILIK